MGIKPWYTTRESVKQALDVKETARSDWQIDDAIEAASRDIEDCCNRVFYPQVATRYFDWPNTQNGTAYVLWLEEDELASVSVLQSGGVAIDSTQYNLEPANQGPPYDRIELKLSGSASFGLGNTRQRDVSVAGVFAGAPVTEVLAGTITVALADTTGTTVSVSDPRRFGVGSLLRIDTERMIVTERSMADSTQDLQADLAATNNAVSVSVSDGTAFRVDEVILLNSEKMRVGAIAGNVLTVARAWDGTVLATHSGSSIYRETALTVERGALGTTAATHLINAAVSVWQAPAPIRALNRAQAIDTVLQEQSGYARTVGSGDNARNASGSALGSLWARVEEHYRRIRLGVV